MRPLEHARTLARRERQALGGTSRQLLERLSERLWEEYQIELLPVNSTGFLQGGRGEVVPAEGCLYYDRAFDKRPTEKLEVVAHEFGHLILHHRRFLPAASDLIRGSVFLDSGAPALARYSPRTQEEAEASAFAAELICPAAEVFGEWRESPSLSSQDLAGGFQATESLVRMQLAEGLYGHVTAAPVSKMDDELPPTPEQEEAATAMGQPVLVDAGPGTGKTRTLVRRVNFLIEEKKIDPEKILVLTFSNEAALELRERIEASLGQQVASRIFALTFHSFGVVVLHALGQHVDLDVDFSILDQTAQEELVSELLGEVDCEALLDIRDPEKTAMEAVGLINYLKDRMIEPDKLRQEMEQYEPFMASDTFKRSAALLRLFQRYESAKKERQRVDFADLILLPHRLFSHNEAIREEIRGQFPWVMVDEYQDVSRATALLLQQICGEANPPWVVGDARQAIYRFRGAEPENVTLFHEDFPAASSFHLSDNYRSAPEIIALANRLAALLDDDEAAGAVPERWRPGRRVEALESPPVVLAAASSDAAERDGVVDRVAHWLGAEVPEEQIAVLARRNIDVRNIAIALKERGIRAVTTGLLTAEGAGGDLAAVVTCVDQPTALPRLVYALWRKTASPEILNEVSRQLLAVDPEAEEEPKWGGSSEARGIAEKTWRTLQALRKQFHSGDGWTVLCDYLFFLSPYLQDLLNAPGHAETTVQLEEVLSALSLAANYRFTHPHVRPRWSRLGLAERLRSLVTQAAPGLVPPRPQAGAVRVMTCHASKGLEFPCVAVVGQSLPDLPPQRPCLPPSVRPNRDDDALQAESLLFVGVTRAQKAVLVSYASSASGSKRSRPRRLPNLLQKWRQSGEVKLQEWQAPAVVSEQIVVGPIWGGEPPEELSPYSLAARTCRVRTYLEEYVGVRFRGRARPLYPAFMSRVRRMLRRVMNLALTTGRKVSRAEADEIFKEEWPVDLDKNHPHLALYRPRAQRWTRSLADVLDPGRIGGEPVPEAELAELSGDTVEWQDPSGVCRRMRLELIGQFRDPNGRQVAIALQVKAPGDSNDYVNWSKLNDYQRLPFVLLQERYGTIEPLLFSGEEGKLRSFRWHKSNPTQAMRKDTEGARRAFVGLYDGAFDGTVSDWTCDRCRCRTVCPWWIGAATGEA